MINKLIIVIIFLSSKLLFAQSFDKYFTGIGDDVIWKALEDSKGSFFVLGHRNMSKPGTYPFLAQLNNEGSIQKTNYFDTLGAYAVFWDVIWSNDSNLIVAGGIATDTALNYQPIVAKINRELKIIWLKKYPAFKKYNYFSRIRYNLDGDGYYLCGNANNENFKDSRGITAKLDLNGNQIIYKEQYFGEVLTQMFDILETHDNGYISTIFDATFAGIPYTLCSKLIRFNSALDFDTITDLIHQGVPQINILTMFNYCRMEWLDSSRLIIQGSVNNNTDTDPSDDDRDMGILLFNYNTFKPDTLHPYGNDKFWDYSSIQGISFKDTSSIFNLVTHDFTYDPYPPANQSQFYVVNVNSLGLRNWDKYYSNGSHLVAKSILATRDGGALITGSSYLAGYNLFGENDGYVLKIGPNGESNITPAGVKSNQSEKFEFNIFPNPTDGRFNIEVPWINLPGFVGIYDLSMREVYRTEITIQIKEIDLEIPQGMYIVKVDCKEGSQTAKIIIK